MKQLGIFEKMRMREKVIGDAIKSGMRGAALRALCADVEVQYPMSDEEVAVWADCKNAFEKQRRAFGR